MNDVWDVVPAVFVIVMVAAWALVAWAAWRCVRALESIAETLKRPRLNRRRWARGPDAAPAPPAG